MAYANRALGARYWRRYMDRRQRILRIRDQTSGNHQTGSYTARIEPDRSRVSRTGRHFRNSDHRYWNYLDV